MTIVRREHKAHFSDGLRLDKTRKTITRADTVPISCIRYAGSFVNGSRAQGINASIPYRNQRVAGGTLGSATPGSLLSCKAMTTRSRYLPSTSASGGLGHAQIGLEMMKRS